MGFSRINQPFFFRIPFMETSISLLKFVDFVGCFPSSHSSCDRWPADVPALWPQAADHQPAGQCWLHHWGAGGYLASWTQNVGDKKIWWTEKKLGTMVLKKTIEIQRHPNICELRVHSSSRKHDGHRTKWGPQSLEGWGLLYFAQRFAGNSGDLSPSI